ncbi:hypothetical protein E6C55_28665 [Cohnella fermenti]|uniref:Uncharacterized protein n=1 Tax=Cohnella fermenti TaxID=2565925 RepID=A0A4S4BGK6_9BACL|nr:hypothetical protein E6C55_28665 [Cohnella fermenti]
MKNSINGGISGPSCRMYAKNHIKRLDSRKFRPTNVKNHIKSQKLHILKPNHQTTNQIKPRNRKPQTANRKRQTTNRKRQTANNKSRNHKPQTEPAPPPEQRCA